MPRGSRSVNNESKVYKLHPQQLDIDGAFVFDWSPIADDRGLFARLFCERELAEQCGITRPFVQANYSTNNACGTLRGLHFLAAPKMEGKLVRCLRGEVQDIFVDLRKGSPTRLNVVSIVLSRENGKMVYVPPGCAHGYLTLTNEADVVYLVQDHYERSSDRVLAWDDTSLNIPWVVQDRYLLSERDKYGMKLKDFSASDFLDW